MDLVRRAVEEIWNQGDLDLADTLFAPTYVNHGGLIPDLVCGPESIKIGVALFRTAFPRLHVDVVELTAEGKTVELRWSASSTPAEVRSDGGLSDRPQALTGTTLGRLSNGQIVESWTFWDRTDVLKRLEIVLPEPGMAPDARIVESKEPAAPPGTHRAVRR
jgi:hypothetical protein